MDLKISDAFGNELLVKKDENSFCVVTPNYNMAEYLEETIQSVLKNLRPGDEYFVIDGGSTDGSVEIIKKYESQITGWINEPDNGYADALRKGFAMSSAPLMCWVNSGDLLLKGALDLVRDKFLHSRAEFLFGDDYYINENGMILQHSSGYVSSLQKMMLYGGWTPLQDACFWRRSLYNLVGGIDKNVCHAADYDFFLRMSLKGRCEYFPAVLSAFRRHASQKSVAGADAYASERQEIRTDALNNFDSWWGIKLIARLRYRLQGYVRAHLKHLNQKESENIGTHVSDITATPSTSVNE